MNPLIKLNASITGIYIMHYNGKTLMDGRKGGHGGRANGEMDDQRNERKSQRGESIREAKRLNFFQPINQVNKHSNFFGFEGFL